MTVSKPNFLQGDILIAFHDVRVTHSVVVRASDTVDLIILVLGDKDINIDIDTASEFACQMYG